jgi:hypothetical protein
VSRHSDRYHQCQGEKLGMPNRDIPNLLQETASLLSQFGRLMANLRTAHEQADDDDERAARLVYANLVRPAMTSFFGILDRQFT